MTSVVQPGVEAFRAAYDAAYDAWKALMDNKPTTALRQAAKAAAHALDPSTMPDAPWVHPDHRSLVRDCAEELRDAVLYAPHKRGDWGYPIILALVRVCPVLIAYETPDALCPRCEMRADEGGGPSCDCGK